MESVDLKAIALLYAKANELNDFIAYGSVAAAIQTVDGNVFTGVSIDTACSMGFCAEHAAVAEMLKHGESKIKRVVAVTEDGNAVPPCGRCRELMTQLAQENQAAIVEVDNNVYVSLGSLMPYDWKKATNRKW
ncbi:cytidine deaminase [Myroides sp. M-43]|uniref:cytidine deaminase family protein n=1 Tax=Myroides oncorhynchi TaxID=2893756 RepID=UPI001E6139E4|nr:cytidine deaminase [Myroides oncorhynchi]MCC9043510.1 cytidine deaminase [Myroides oncorhynchi]